MTDTPDPLIDELVNDHQKFNDFVYTPIKAAIKDLGSRKFDAGLRGRVLEYLQNDLPTPFSSDTISAVFFGHATPTYEVIRFLSIIESLSSLEPLFLEYKDDKFVPENERKMVLGKMKFFLGRGKNDGIKIDRVRIIDFHKSNGKKLSELQTLWGDNLLEFHHGLFNLLQFKVDQSKFFDISNWLKNHGENPLEYYKSVLTLFICNGILFENFMLNDKEIPFTKHCFLPSFIAVYKKFGVKPLIVPLEPTEIETNEFWVCHPPEMKEKVCSWLSKELL